MRAHLRSNLTATQLRIATGNVNNYVDIKPEGRPEPTFAGRGMYVAIHATSWDPGFGDLVRGLEEIYSIAVTITQPASHIAMDRWEDELVLADPGMLVLARRIAGLVNAAPVTTCQAANALLAVGDTSKYIEHLRFAGVDPWPAVRGSEWIDVEVDPNQNQRYFLVQTVRFTGSKRIHGGAFT